jgi:hypothetical protein
MTLIAVAVWALPVTFIVGAFRLRRHARTQGWKP